MLKNLVKKIRDKTRSILVGNKFFMLANEVRAKNAEWLIFKSKYKNEKK